jgi:hypothetical protein
MPAEDPPYFIGEPRQGYFTRHDVQWKDSTKLIQLELACFREKMAAGCRGTRAGSAHRTFQDDRHGAVAEDAPEGQPRFIWHKWADLMLVRLPE